MADANSIVSKSYKYAFAGVVTKGGPILIDNLESGLAFEYPIGADSKFIDEIIDGMSSRDALVIGIYIERNMQFRRRLQDGLENDSKEASHA